MWTNKGKKKLNEFLADLGLPLNECKQKYSYMDSSYKTDFKVLVASEKIREKYRYDESQIYLSTFIASFGYTNKLTAFDMVYAVESLLENNDCSKSNSDRFIESLNCLNRDNLKTLEYAVELAKVNFRRVFQQIQNFIDMNQIVASGPFLQVFLEEGSQDNPFFAQVSTSKRLARYALQSYLALTKGKKSQKLTANHLHPNERHFVDYHRRASLQIEHKHRKLFRVGLRRRSRTNKIESQFQLFRQFNDRNKHRR